MYEFTQDWIDQSDIKKHLLQIISIRLENHILEIGSYEGASACFFSDVLLNHPNSSLTCVDPFIADDTTFNVGEETFQRFCSNIQRSKHAAKVTLHKMLSRDFFTGNKKLYNLIYIDGSHKLEDIEHDFREAMKIVCKQGVIWMDDYMGGKNNEIKTLIDSLIEEYKDYIHVMFRGWQIAVQVL